MGESRKPLDWQSLDGASEAEVEAFFQVVEQRMKDAVARAIAETDALRRRKEATARRAS